jgi:gentisate 1,2-dioxygenase
MAEATMTDSREREELSAEYGSGIMRPAMVRGDGTTVIDGERFDWGRGDFVALPPWAAHEFGNRSSTDEAVLFHVNDQPALKALGLWREAQA